MSEEQGSFRMSDDDRRALRQEIVGPATTFDYHKAFCQNQLTFPIEIPETVEFPRRVILLWQMQYKTLLQFATLMTDKPAETLCPKDLWAFLERLHVEVRKRNATKEGDNEG